MDIEVVKEIIEQLIIQTYNKVVIGRIRDEKKEEIRLKNIKLLSNLCKDYSSIIESQKVLEIEKQMEILQHKLKSD